MKEQTDEEKIEKISLDKIESRIKKENEKYELELSSIKVKINENISVLISELKSQVEVLKSVNLDKRKEQEKIKQIVMENLYLYIDYLSKLVNELESLDKNLQVTEYIKEIQILFDNFKKRSYKSFEKATILIGKEFEQVQIIIRNFSHNFNIIISENKEKFEKLSIIKKLQNFNQELGKIKKIIEEIKTQIKNSETKEINLKEIKKSQEANYENFKQGDKFKKYLEEKEKSKNNSDKLNQAILRIKEKINIKFLLKHFHHDLKKSKILQDYQENFIRALKNDSNLEILNLAREVSGLDLEQELINLKKEIQIKEKLEETEHPVENEIKNLEHNLSKTNSELLEIQKYLSEENKKLLRFNEKLKEINNDIENSLKYIGIEIVK